MERTSATGLVGKAIGGVLGVAALLILELVATMLVYTWLNLYRLDTTFGWLVRLSKSVLDLWASQLDLWFKGSSNAAYGTLFGELSPKAILLLMIGLVVGTLMRGLIKIIRGLAGGQH